MVATFKVVTGKMSGPLADLGGANYEMEREALDPIGAEIVVLDASDEDAFIAQARDADAIIGRGVRLTPKILAALEKCKVVAGSGVGFDYVDVPAATRAGIVVTNVPDVFIEEVADHTMALLLAGARRMREMDSMVRRGDWFQGRPLLNEVPRLWGQTLGLISFGNVARAVARRAKPFGMHVVAHDPYVSELKMTGEGVEPVSFGELLERSDYLSMHPPLNRETRHMLSGPQFAAMKETAVLINAGRGPTVDEAALIEALGTGQIAAAALDVLEREPPAADNPLLAMDNVILTPHVASATTRMRPETRRRVGREVALALSGRWPMSCVNPTVLPRVELERWQPVPMERGPNR
jgi:D-3-phosphoglycerate dehydrogenase